jgi:acyl-CoA synthetase (AMP-forming)/AMP-acid ligase II
MNICTLLDIVSAMDPDRVVVGDAADGLTAAGLRDLAARAATALTDPDSRPVLFAGEATEAFPVAAFGAAWTGRPFAPLNYRLAVGPFTELLTGQAPALLIAEERTLASIPALPTGIEAITPHEFLERVRAAEPTTEEPVADEELPAVLLHTSGTSGRPKVAVLRHRHLTSYVLGGTEPLSAGPDEAALVSVPPYHIAGVAGLLTGLVAGRRQVQLVAADPAAWLRTAQEQRITHAMVVPTVLARVLDRLEGTEDALPALRHLSYGGGRMPRPLIERALAALPHVGFVNGYGLTETTSSVAVLTPEDHRAAFAATDPAVRRRLESVGRPLPTVEIEVRTESGERAAPGVRGEVVVRGPQVSGEYAGAGRLDDQGWFATNDGGWMDEEGYLFVDGRLDDVIVRGGENMSPGEIEDVLARHPGVAEVAVYGLADLEWGEVVAASVVPAPGGTVTEDELRAWVGSHLRSSRVPSVIRFHQVLPRNDMGKLLRRVLKAEAAPATS